MLFTEPTFLFVFLPVVLALSLWGPIRWRNGVLAVASVVFYARGAGAFTLLILGSIAFNYLVALGVDRRRGTPAAGRLLAASVTLNLAVLGLFKYADFATANLNALLGAAGMAALPIPHVLLPIGISFFTFHAISYVVDVHRGDAVAQKGPVAAALYLLLFPQLIAGPIIRYRQIATQLTSRFVSAPDFAYGIRRFVIGLGKKMLIANVVAVPADRLFALPPDQLTAAHAWIATICYTLQIYFDFSGYSDMALGLGRLFGFHFPENFRYPYVAVSIQDFWRRWHMSLSAWFRDYLYVPLGGNRVSTSRLYVNLLTVFFLCGLWHGANWTFVVWGLYHGMFLVLERLRFGRWVDALPSSMRHAYALLVVMIGWVFFRADSLAGALGVLRAMAGASPAAPTAFAPSWYLTPELLLALVAGVVASTPVLPALAAPVRTPDARFPGAVSALATLGLVVLFTASLMLIAARTYNPFIYFRF